MKKLMSGKVREIYEVDKDKLAIVTTDRISAFAVILSKPVIDKGKVLNGISLFWFDFTKDIIPNHIITSKLNEMPDFFQKPEFEGRTVLVKRLKILPFECIVRGYCFGSMWEAYTKGQEFCGLKIEGNYKQAEKLKKPLFTPSTKAPIGQHDEAVSFETVADALGKDLAEHLRDASIKLYEAAFNYAYKKGIIIADTKFEFGLDENGRLVLADEILTPDSSRFWSLADYKVGVSPKSYDKQFVRDWLLNNKVNGEMQFDNVPDDILKKTSDIYKECLRKITQ